MIDENQLPVVTKPIDKTDSFAFACHKGVSCFTECCRMLELALSPYDILRLRHSTGKTSTELLDQFVIMEQDPGEPFPRFYLTMVDDGRASCIFVSTEGCTIYPDRPAACRTYPLGRGAQKNPEGMVVDHFILIQENHCHGFAEPATQTPIEYTADQELSPYYRFNDLVAGILQHDSIRKGFIPSKKQIELFTLVLYDIDRFRILIEKGEIQLSGANAIANYNDEQLLERGVGWISNQLFPQLRKLAPRDLNI
ncbi:MAG: Fe-S-cluster containining protein [Desulforhopalus sp.]|jgi:Fe-S-cluster containining protein